MQTTVVRKRFLVRLAILSAALLIICLPGCVRKHPQEVVVYAALDREFSEPLLQQFEQETGIHVLAKYDIESNKTVGLATAIVAEKNRPRCDVFWNNEILHSVRLAQAGLAEPGHSSPHASSYPAEYVAADSSWHGFAARARVLIVNTDRLTSPDDYPTSVRDLADPRWKNNCGMARPLFGTTATHAAVLVAAWGEQEALAFLQSVRDNAVIEGGNRQVAQHVAEGRYAWGITDTDDAIIQIEKGAPVKMVWPDQGNGQPGTLLIPNTLMIVRGGPNQANAIRLVDWLLRTETESELAASASAQIPLRTDATSQSRVWPTGNPPRTFRPDYDAAAKSWDSAGRQLGRIFQ